MPNHRHSHRRRFVPRPYQDEVEQCFTDYRAGLQAERQLESNNFPEEGAIATFHGALRVEKNGSTVTWWPIKDLTYEPGTVFEPGITEIEGWAKPYGVKIRLKFHVIVGDVPIDEHPLPHVEWEKEPPKGNDFALLLPRNIRSEVQPGTALTRSLRRLASQVGPSRNKIIEISRPYAEQIVRRKGVPISDQPDVIQELLITASKKADQFAAPGRPDCSWYKALENDLNRDADRTIWDMRGESESIGRIRAWLKRNPDVKTAEEAHLLMSTEKHVARLVRAGMTRTEAEAQVTSKVALENEYASLSQFKKSMRQRIRMISIDASYTKDPNDEGSFSETLGEEESGYRYVEAVDLEPVIDALAEVSGLTHDEMQDLYNEVWNEDSTPKSQLPSSERTRLSKIEEDFFSPFVLWNEDWRDPDDRDIIKTRFLQFIVPNGSFLTSDLIEEAWEEAVTRISKQNASALVWGYGSTSQEG